MLDDYPSAVYKYRQWGDTYGEQVLKDGVLYLSSPADFNDPFDCRVFPNIYLLNTKELKLKFALALVSRHGEDLDRLGFTPNSRVEQIFSRID